MDYNPVDGGLRVGVAGLAGLPLGDNSVYTVRAEIGTNSFNWNSRPSWQKSIDGTYQFEVINSDFELRKFKADEKTFVLYTVSRHDFVTKETIHGYAFGMQPLIHVLGKRQFLICGQY